MALCQLTRSHRVGSVICMFWKQWKQVKMKRVQKTTVPDISECTLSDKGYVFTNVTIHHRIIPHENNLHSMPTRS